MIIKRILELLESRNLKMSDLCRYLDINTSTMTNWKNRNTDPPAKFIIPICEFLGVSCEYVLTGTERISTYSKEDAEWLSMIHELPKDAQLEFKGELKGYLKRIEHENSKREMREAK